MRDEDIAKLCDVVTTRTYEPNEDIIKQDTEGREFFILDAGEARVWKQQGDDVLDYTVLKEGALFGELALLQKGKKRALNVTAKTHVRVLVLPRKRFERLFGPMDKMHAQQYLTDPRRVMAEFYQKSDSRGPKGSLDLKGLEPDPKLTPTCWFVVYRPTSHHSMNKMLSLVGVGKGLNVKGKSAKGGVLSGFVPFMQISDNAHKEKIEKSPADTRIQLYFKSDAARKEASRKLEALMDTIKLENNPKKMTSLDSYIPLAYGLDMPERLMHKAYITDADLTPMIGWETGRRSEPAFMDMNLHAVRDQHSEPKVCLYQYDESNCMNPRGLLVAYAEKFVKPVVSDFDTFLVGSKGMTYEPLAEDQVEIIDWTLKNTEKILRSPSERPWNSRWLDVLKDETWHPEFPKYGFGDPTSYRLIGDIVKATEDYGAVRHGAECFNFYFPQELDDQYLVVWDGFTGEKPFAYQTEPEVREFLLARIKQGYVFPLNPVWPVRDSQWYEVFEALRNAPGSAEPLKAWFPPKRRILERVDELHKTFPQGFVQAAEAVPPPDKKEKRTSGGHSEHDGSTASNGLKSITRAVKTVVKGS